VLGEFKTFAVRGNLVDLAVGFVMGVAFTALVTSFVDDILMQLVAAIFGETDFSALAFTLNGSEIRYGAFVTALVVFVQIALALFLILKFVERLRRENADEGIVAPPEDVVLLREIRDALVADQGVSGTDSTRTLQ
jgi:large conductance mechanosensitive channel